MRTSIALIFSTACLFALSAAPVSAQSDELAAIKAQLAELQAKVAELERRQTQPLTGERADTAVAHSRAPAEDWVSRIQWKGDLRYRNETIDQQFAAAERNRDRIRLRAGFTARVNEQLRTEVRVATTENGDARSSNQTLTNASSRKAIDLDLAYAEWSPNESWKAMFGKMPQPWHTTSSFFFDKDINPEGVAVKWQHAASGLFANAFYTRLFERSSQADSDMAGAQIGWRGEVASGTRLTLAAGYFDHHAVEGYNPVQDGDVTGSFGAFGNSITTTCKAGLSTCIANDFNVLELSAELSTALAGKPFTMFLDYGRNSAADFSSAVISAGLDTAWAAGFQWGRVSGPRTWEIGYIHQVTEKDSLFGQWIDSDFAAGRTDGGGGAIRLGFGLGRNFRINGTYFLTETDMDVPTTVTGVGSVADRDYKRLQLDLNMSF